MIPNHVVLIVNPGSTSTKIAICNEDGISERETFQHDVDVLKTYKTVWAQYEYRLQLCTEWVKGRITRCSAVVSLGGLLKPVDGGTYIVTDKMLQDARNNIQGEHASNLGCALASEIAQQYGCPAYVVDPVSVDEFEPLAYYSGHPLVTRRSLSHALSIHAAAYKAAGHLGRPINSTSFIVCHLGGGISIAPVRGGKIIDVNDAASDGPFSPERTGGLPLQPFITLCCSGKFTEDELRRLVMGKGGLVAYVGTSSVPDIEKRIAEGEQKAREVLEAMAYQIGKEIGAMATVLEGKVDAVILTGGIAKSTLLTDLIEKRVRFLGPVIIQTGDDEVRALADAAFRVLRGETELKEYPCD